MPWTRLDFGLTMLALLLALLVLGHRAYELFYLNSAAGQVMGNIEQVAESVEKYHNKTGRWFPPADTNWSGAQVYPDPFHHDRTRYQGLDEELLWFEHNFGIVLQLIRFDAAGVLTVPANLFEQPFRFDEPYLRVLLDYDSEGRVEIEILDRLESRLPQGALAELDDHYYVIDLRRIIDVK